VNKAVEKGLSKKPAQRFSTVRSFVKALKEPSPEITVSDAATVAVDSDPSIMGDLPTEVMDAADTPRPEAPTSAASAARAPATLVPPAPKKKGGIWKVLVPLIVILAAGGGGVAWWWMTQRDSSGGQTQAEQTEPSGVPSDAELLGETAAGSAAESTATEPEPPEPASVTISGMLPSGLVIVDGVAQSSQEFDLSPGEPHVIVMRQAGYETITDTVTFEPGQQVRYPYVGRSVARPTQTVTQPRQTTPRRPAAPQTGIVQIRIRPWANVFIGNQEFSQTSTVVDTLLAGEPHTIRFRRPGFVNKDTVVFLEPGQTARITIRLEEGGII
jgi:hypothetical protein